MLAPIALYPDALLSQVLMASSYPIEVIEADRWVRRNPELKGEELDAALLERDWDPSVKAMCHFPSILNLMSDRISETTTLGNAFIAQEAEVMDMVQELRAKAHARNTLASDDKQKVIVEKETIIIESADPRVIYVSYYDPAYIYGPWWYPAYPPRYWGPPGVRIGMGISYWPGFYFSFGFGAWSYFDWHHHYIHIDVHQRPRYVRHDRWITHHGRWHHVPVHRRGVAYRDEFTARKYHGQYPPHSRVSRRDSRGFPEQRDSGSLRRGEDRTGIDRNKPGDHRINNERVSQDRERVYRDGRDRERAGRDGQRRERIDRDRRERDRDDGHKRLQQQIDRGNQERQRSDRDGRIPAYSTRERQGRERFAPERKENEAGVRNLQQRQQLVSDKREHQWVRPEQQQKRRDNVSVMVNDNRVERPSSDRGRVGWQGAGDGTRGRGRLDESGRGGRDDWDRNRR